MAKKSVRADLPEKDIIVRAIVAVGARVSIEEYLEFLDWLGSEVECREMAAKEDSDGE